MTKEKPGLQSGNVAVLGDIAAALVASDPLDQAGRVLARLLAHSGASGGAILVPGTDTPRVLVARNVALPNLESLPSLWQRNERGLRSGRPGGRDGRRLIPLQDGSDVVGAVYLEGARLEAEKLRVYLRILTRAVLAATDPEALRAIGADLLGVGVERSKREITLASLEHHEWNISRVARELGLTRRTIYLRLARWGVARERVPKTVRRLVTEEA